MIKQANSQHVMFSILLIRTGIALLLGLVAIYFVASPILAQSTPEPQEEPAAEEFNTDAITDNQVREVARTLWCPLCSGVRLDSCELMACHQMREEIAIMLAEGQDRETIRAQFVDLYGPQVLGEPPREGWNWLAWVLPFVALAAGGGFLLSRARQMVRSDEDEAPIADDAPAADGQEGSPEPDSYEQKLEDELARYS